MNHSELLKSYEINKLDENWCYPPDATEFVKAKNKLKPKTVEGCSFDHLKNMLNEKNV